VAYESFSAARFFPEITTEAEARTLLWRSRFQGKEFHCPRGHAEQCYALVAHPEVRTCKGCRRQWRLRAGTIVESSKTSLLLWVNALFYDMQGKRGMSAQELQRHWGLQSYGRVWSMPQKIRAALQHRDAGYQVGAGVIELDAGTFGRRETGHQCDVLVAIETKAWVNAKGQARSRAGFAKVLVGKETTFLSSTLPLQGGPVSPHCGRRTSTF